MIKKQAASLESVTLANAKSLHHCYTARDLLSCIRPATATLFESFFSIQLPLSSFTRVPVGGFVGAARFIFAQHQDLTELK